MPHNGWYTIEVADKWGRTDKRQEEVKVDTIAPKSLEVQSYIISDNESDNENEGTNNAIPTVKKGDFLFLNVKADKEIKSIGSPNAEKEMQQYPAVKLVTENSDYNIRKPRRIYT